MQREEPPPPPPGDPDDGTYASAHTGQRGGWEDEQRRSPLPDVLDPESAMQSLARPGVLLLRSAVLHGSQTFFAASCYDRTLRSQ